MRAVLLAATGALCLVAGAVITACLIWSAPAGAAAGLVVVGAGLLWAGLTFDLDSKE